jgi:hypothetical protein
MRAHQPGSTPIDIPETVPNPAHTPAPAPAPERAPTKVPDEVPEKVIAPASFDAFFRPVIWPTPRPPWSVVLAEVLIAISRGWTFVSRRERANLRRTRPLEWRYEQTSNLA